MQFWWRPFSQIVSNPWGPAAARQTRELMGTNMVARLPKDVLD
jgi:hypothetical protein